MQKARIFLFEAGYREWKGVCWGEGNKWKNTTVFPARHLEPVHRRAQGYITVKGAKSQRTLER